ncbi:hypothetical protein GCM10011382_11380 [Vreelandella lutescens]|uniref:Uncharacterized protein n=1 Tax=Vreelandella lutescens TaxID=1602943 RepID=A0ABQ1NSR0_9GAMM|nr:hypothetical protein GCM10011382_11380 [Halomonas lutescens]
MGIAIRVQVAHAPAIHAPAILDRTIRALATLAPTTLETGIINTVIPVRSVHAGSAMV